MTKNSLSRFKKYLTVRNSILLVLALLVIFTLFPSGKEEVIEEVEVETRVKELPVVVFGSWQPESSREVLATVASSGDVDIVAENAGTIENVFVSLGSRVTKGQILARFRAFDDKNFVDYENSLRDLQTTKLSSENSVRSSEISLDTAERELRQTELSNNQSLSKARDALLIEAQNAETVFFNALNWADSTMGGSERFRSRVTRTNVNVGLNDRIQRRATKNDLENIVYRTENLVEFDDFQADNQTYIVFGETRLGMLFEIQRIIRDVDSMIRRSNFSSTFSESDRSALQTQSESFLASLATQITNLETKIESLKSQEETNKLSLITALNKVENSQASLELARSTADAQVATAENKVSSARVSRLDLEVKAPFDGVITEKNVSNFDQTTVGQKLFSLVSESVTPKIVGFVTTEELDRLLTAETVRIRLANDEMIGVSKSYLSFKVDPETQKIRAEFSFNDFPKGVLVGSFAKILVPLRNGHTNLLPISSLSFEPGGAEVLIVDDENIARRQKVSFGKIMSDSVEILDGLLDGQQVIQFRNRAHAGEKIELTSN